MHMCPTNGSTTPIVITILPTRLIYSFPEMSLSLVLWSLIHPRKHCNSYKACRETISIAHEIYPDLGKVVLDMDLSYHVPSRNAFCKFWTAKYGRVYEGLLSQTARRPIVPTATAYVAFLYRNGLAEHLYHFSNTLQHGSKKLFVRASRTSTPVH